MKDATESGIIVLMTKNFVRVNIMLRRYATSTSEYLREANTLSPISIFRYAKSTASKLSID